MLLAAALLPLCLAFPSIFGLRGRLRGAVSRFRGDRAPEAAPQPLRRPRGGSLSFNDIPATPWESKLIDSTLLQLKDLGDESDRSDEWMRRLTPTDVLRYVRASTSPPKRSSDADTPLDTSALATVWERLQRTSAWREEFGVDAIARDPAYSMERFFAEPGASRLPSQPEVEWLAGHDARGRPVLIFYADRHTPGDIASEEWLKFVVHHAEGARLQRGVEEGPVGGFTLLVDRSTSGLVNQDPVLALKVLPTCLDHYPELLSSVLVAPINPIFWIAWRVVRVFLSDTTAAKFVLVRGSDWKAELAEAMGPAVKLPASMR